jgi:aspartyl/glutamyl-tRNA(Asn/Gln) amidotransferase C subunit
MVDIKHLADLTSLSVSSVEANKLAGQFQETLSVIKNLEELDTAKTVPTSQVTGQVNRFREDVIDLSRTLTLTEVMANAPKKHHGFFVVPAIFNHQ